MLEKVTTKQFATNEDMVEGSMISEVIFIIVKGHLILKANCQAVFSPKKLTKGI